MKFWKIGKIFPMLLNPPSEKIKSIKRLLAIESSCDETSVAIAQFELLKENRFQNFQILKNHTWSQSKTHSPYGGVIPELAAREHSSKLSSLIKETCQQTEISLKEIDGFAATQGPGLSSSLLVGHSFAKALACSFKKPFFSINHLQAHLLSPFISKNPPHQKHIGLIVSGGHTLLIHSKAWNDNEIICSTLDDAAGEALDKAARMLKLPYPGGPEIEKMAKNGNNKAYSFPRPLPQSLNFSFSGLKTSLLYTLKKEPLTNSEKKLSDLCASFQQAIIDTLTKKTIKTAKIKKCDCIGLSGGVANNQSLRKALKTACQKEKFHFLPASPEFCGDNAGMIAYLAIWKYSKQQKSSLKDDIAPNLKFAKH